MKYTSNALRWGCELEFGDIPRWVDIPSHLGSWEYFETDIVNQREPYWGIASDPFGINPPFGGEINTVPTKTWTEQIEIVNELIEYFTKLGYPPTVSCVQQFHIHVSLPKELKLKRNIHIMKSFVSYMMYNQKDFIEITSGFALDPRMSESAISFLRDDGGLVAPNSMYKDMLTCDSLYEMTKKDQTESINNIMKRFGINFKSLAYNQTLEFRSFRATLNLVEYAHAFRACEKFILDGINGSQSKIAETISQGYKFPRFQYDHDLFCSWEKTKKSKRLDVNKH